MPSSCWTTCRITGFAKQERGKSLNSVGETVDVYGRSGKTRNSKAIVSPAEMKLRKEFQSLVGKLGVQNLELVWIPDSGKGLCGEVRNGVLYVYEEDEGRALEALKHELVDYLITSRVVKPLVELVNLLIKSRESEIYKEKEKLVEILSKLLV